MCEYSKPCPEALGKCLSLIAALTGRAAGEHGGTEKGGMGQNGGMAPRLVPFAIFSSTIPPQAPHTSRRHGRPSSTSPKPRPPPLRSASKWPPWEVTRSKKASFAKRCSVQSPQ